MELTQLRYFQVVARYQHMTRAAAELNISQPALSTVIARLDKELGIPLFDRNSRAIFLNQNGEAFLRRVNRILIEVDDSKRELQNMAQDSDMLISLAVTSPQFLQGMDVFIRQHPDFKWQQRVEEIQNIRFMLLSGQIDLAVSSPGIYDEDLISTLLLRDKFMIAVHPDHPLANRKSVCLTEIANERFIMLQKGLPFRTQTDQLFADLGITPNYIMECDHLLRRELINANVGIGIASSSAQFRHLYDPQVRFLEIEDVRRTRNVVLTCRKNKYMTRAAREFAAYLQNKFQGYRKQSLQQFQTEEEASL